MKITDKQIREHLYHGEGSRKVVIHRDGSVQYHGSREDTDRGNDYWHFGGYRDELAREVEACLTADTDYYASEE